MSLKQVNDYNLFQSLFSGYLLCDQETKSSDADIKYYLYVNRFGEWYIMQEDLSPAGGTDPKTWRFIKGDSDYATNWTAREALVYAYPNVAFK